MGVNGDNWFGMLGTCQPTIADGDADDEEARRLLVAFSALLEATVTRGGRRSLANGEPLSGSLASAVLFDAFCAFCCVKLLPEMTRDVGEDESSTGQGDGTMTRGTTAQPSVNAERDTQGSPGDETSTATAVEVSKRPRGTPRSRRALNESTEGGALLEAELLVSSSRLLDPPRFAAEATTVSGSASPGGPSSQPVRRPLNKSDEHAALRAALDRLDACDAAFNRATVLSRRLDAALCPAVWILAIDGVMVVAQLLVAVAAAASTMRDPVPSAALVPIQASPWLHYQLIYFRVFNSASLTSWIVGTALRSVLGADRWSSNRLFAVAVFIAAPPFVTHVAPMLLWYPHLAFFAAQAAALFALCRRHVKHWSRGHFALRALSVMWVYFSLQCAFSMAFNLGVLTYSQSASAVVGGKGGAGLTAYFDRVQVDWASRRLACSCQILFSNVANFLQHSASFLFV